MKLNFSLCRFSVCVIALMIPNCVASAQQPNGWKAHDKNRPAPPVVDPGSDNTTASVPSDAIVLFAGTDLNQWRSAKGTPAGWKIVDGAMESVPGAGYVYTKQKFGDCQLHIEWASPVQVKGAGQGRGNSGVYLMGQFEVQVLDSFENPTYADGSAGSIYGQFPPLVNASRQPGQWQAYDIVFRAPRFESDDSLKSPALITVLHNGVVIQHGTKPFGPSNWILHTDYSAGKSRGPIGLQDHGNPVRYRNIWIRELSDRPLPNESYPAARPLSEQEIQQIVGGYGAEKVLVEDGRLYLQTAGRKFAMIAVQGGGFALQESAGTIRFQRDPAGRAISLTVDLDCGKKGQSDRNETADNPSSKEKD